MKNIFVSALLILSSLSTIAQQVPGNMRDPQAREKIRAAHAAYLTERMELTASESEKFWPIYREYTEKRRTIRQEIRDLRQTEQQQFILDSELRLKQKELDLEKEYTEKLQKVVPAEKLVKMKEAETDFRKLLLRKVQERRRGHR